MKRIALFFVVILIAKNSFAMDCMTAKAHLKKAVPMAAATLKVLSCEKFKEGDTVTFKGEYSTPITIKSGNHIPYEVFYRNGKLSKIRFFNDPNDVVYASDIEST